jgi:hypothetical protein
MVHKSKSKGNRYENQVYKELREVLPDIKLTIGSGNSESDSDLVSDHFVMELKHYKTLSDNQIKKFWAKVSSEAQQHNKQPVLIYKENYKVPKVMINMHLGACTLPATIDYLAFKDILEMGFYNEDTLY